MSATVPRTPIKALRPLTNQQIDYFKTLGQRDAADRYTTRAVWWHQYFSQPDGTPIPINDWDVPGLDVSNKRAYFEQVDTLNALLNGARTNRAVARKMVSQGIYPPNPGSDPFVVPPYFSWWQSENAFRRGYMEYHEDRSLDLFKTTLKEIFHDDGNILTQDGMEKLSNTYTDDPYIALYFTMLAEDLEQGKPEPFDSLKALYNDLLRRREHAYRQFSPYFVPLRWAPGAGLVGIDLG